jgi:hypothetical protein
MVNAYGIIRGQPWSISRYHPGTYGKNEENYKEKVRQTRKLVTWPPTELDTPKNTSPRVLNSTTICSVALY